MPNPDSLPIVVSGIGIMASNGAGKDQVWQAIQDGRSRMEPVTLFDTSQFTSKKAAEIADFNPGKILGEKGLRLLDRTTKLGLCAAKYALDDARFPVEEGTSRRLGVALSSAMGSVESRAGYYLDLYTEGFVGLNPAIFPNTVINSPASQIAIHFKTTGFNTTISNGFTGTLDALLYGANMIRWNKADAVLAGGVEALNPFIYAGFEKMGFLSRKTPDSEEMIRPFDRRRNGSVLGEGAVVLVLETLQNAERRGAPLYAEIASGRTLFDRESYLRYPAGGESLGKAIRHIFSKESIGPDSIDFVSASANGTRPADASEAKALFEVLGSGKAKPLAAASKSLFGETFGASGGFQVAYALFGLEKNLVPPSLNCEQIDPECGVLCTGTTPREKKIRNVLVSSVSPMGYSSAVLLRKPPL
ncbi:MAG TPA: beta-ketoacyl-[acyl-carrier-protein] synthase family protein [Spirochaetia bacterium]|nr:beta-ketoacyl-[acyl-carrier-protein] synthase family protein [Spirochaetia bacterium]